MLFLSKYYILTRALIILKSIGVIYLDYCIYETFYSVVSFWVVSLSVLSLAYADNDVDLIDMLKLQISQRLNGYVKARRQSIIIIN